MRFTSLALVAVLALAAPHAAAETFDVVTYTTPKRWSKTTPNGGVQLAITDAQSGEYALALIIKSTATTDTPEKNFTSVWNTMVKATMKVSSDPTKQPNATKDGWTLVTGGAEFTNGTQKGVALLITATGGGKMASLIIMTNTARFQADIEALVGSMALTPTTGSAPMTSGRSVAPATTTRVDRSAIVDKLWEGVTTEKFQNGPSKGYNTGGFWTATYRFSANGTYTYSAIGASAWIDNNTLNRESGTYTIDGDQLTVVPTAGTNEEWTVVGAPIKVAALSDVEIRKIKEHWGKRVKKVDSKRGKTTFTASQVSLDGGKQRALILKASDGNQNYLYETAPSKARTLPKD